jgi:hypothetical protein
VVFYALFVDGAEGVEADMEGDGGPADALCAKLREETLGEVEAGGGGGSGAFGAGVDGLVALGVGWFLVDVGRERQLAEVIEERARGDVEVEDASA